MTASPTLTTAAGTDLTQLFSTNSTGTTFSYTSSALTSTAALSGIVSALHPNGRAVAYPSGPTLELAATGGGTGSATLATGAPLYSSMCSLFVGIGSSTIGYAVGYSGSTPGTTTLVDNGSSHPGGLTLTGLAFDAGSFSSCKLAVMFSSNVHVGYTIWLWTGSTFTSTANVDSGAGVGFVAGGTGGAPYVVGVWPWWRCSDE
jgi:hypothetical protein